jgi:crotonobetainyl-CoA:carnitine CoA-transferase CaiB-like acyl-CoA transferase
VTTEQWNGLMRAVGRDELVGHPDYDTPQGRGRNGGPLMKEISAQLKTMSTEDVVARLTEQGVPNAAITGVQDLPALMEKVAPGYLVLEDHPVVGEILHPRPAVIFDEDLEVRPAPALGEHTDEIKAELGR